jgi:hypothetical protein
MLGPFLISRISARVLFHLLRPLERRFPTILISGSMRKKDGAGAGLTPLDVTISAEYCPISD